MFIRNSDRTKLSFPPILIRDQEQRIQIGEKSVFFILVRLKQHISSSLNQASVMFSVVRLKNKRMFARNFLLTHVFATFQKGAIHKYAWLYNIRT